MNTGGKRLSTSRKLVFAAAVTVLLLAGINFGIELLERRGVVSTHRVDDHVQFVTEALFEQSGDWVVTTAYARQFLVPARFRADKGDRFRVFVVGASFAMGTPYTSQSDDAEQPGGIATWLRIDLERRYGPDGFEVINAAASAQTSHRVQRVAEEVLGFEPDLLFVATCNNEGPPRPSYVREQLHKLGAYRLLTTLAAPSVAPENRPTFTPQGMEPEQIRSEFTENLAGILGAAEAAGVPVAMATLPVHLRYGGPGAPLPPGDEAGAIPESPCVAAGRETYQRGEFKAALAELGACAEDIPDAARWTGLSLAALGRVEEAKVALELSIELLPRNRCRPSLNASVRSLAEASATTHLIDLEAAAQGLSPQGLPGPELFIDYCHLNWRGYAAMTEELVATLEVAGVLPAAGVPKRPLEELAVTHELGGPTRSAPGARRLLGRLRSDIVRAL